VWLEKDGLKACKEDFEAKQKELQTTMTAILMRMNQAQDFWDQQVTVHEGEKTIAQGGFLLECGVDIRDLIEEPN